VQATTAARNPPQPQNSAKHGTSICRKDNIEAAYAYNRKRVEKVKTLSGRRTREEREWSAGARPKARRALQPFPAAMQANRCGGS